MRRPIAPLLLLLALAGAACAQDAPSPEPTPTPAPAGDPAAAPAALRVDVGTLASVAVAAATVVISGVLGGVKLIRDGYIHVLRSEIDGLRRQYEAIDRQNSDQLAKIIYLQGQLQSLSTGACPFLRADGSCSRGPAPPAPHGGP